MGEKGREMGVGASKMMMGDNCKCHQEAFTTQVIHLQGGGEEASISRSSASHPLPPLCNSCFCSIFHTSHILSSTHCLSYLFATYFGNIKGLFDVKYYIYIATYIYICV